MLRYLPESVWDRDWDTSIKLMQKGRRDVNPVRQKCNYVSLALGHRYVVDLNNDSCSTFTCIAVCHMCHISCCNWPCEKDTWVFLRTWQHSIILLWPLCGVPRNTLLWSPMVASLKNHDWHALIKNKQFLWQETAILLSKENLPIFGNSLE